MKPAHALVVASLALGVAVGGTAFAVGGTPSYKPNVITASDKFTVSNANGPDFGQGTAKCPSGYEVVGGGYATTGAFTNITVAAPFFKTASYGVDAYEPIKSVYVPVTEESSHVYLIAFCAPHGRPAVYMKNPAKAALPSGRKWSQSSFTNPAG